MKVAIAAGAIAYSMSTATPVAYPSLGAAGWFDRTGDTVLFSPHLAWRHSTLRKDLAARLQRPLWVGNDADAAAWAEYRYGAARGAVGAPGSAVHDSTSLQHVDPLPQRLVIVGAGTIGLEFASMFAGYGAEAAPADSALNVRANAGIIAPSDHRPPTSIAPTPIYRI